ncbi:MAG TPA: diheme cytochrome C [Leptolyngbyaceae cyanobacterium]
MFGERQQQVRPNTYLLRKRQKLIGLLLLLCLGSAIVSWCLTLVTELPAQSQPVISVSRTGTVDIVPQRYQLGQELYLKNCASCHIGVPPATLPTETWLDIIQDSQHYGKELKPLVDPERLLVWEYLRTFSRARSPEEERTPYRVIQSRYFRALHPQVKLSPSLALGSCVSCHPRVTEYDFRTLSSEWQNAP